jgi:hypothetical protein
MKWSEGFPGFHRAAAGPELGQARRTALIEDERKSSETKNRTGARVISLLLPAWNRTNDQTTCLYRLMHGQLRTIIDLKHGDATVTESLTIHQDIYLSFNSKTMQRGLYYDASNIDFDVEKKKKQKKGAIDKKGKTTS